MAEHARIDKEIDAIQKGQMRVLPRDTALERTREIISLADDLTGDFRRVRDQFEQLNRVLRERIMDSLGTECPSGAGADRLGCRLERSATNSVIGFVRA